MSLDRVRSLLRAADLAARSNQDDRAKEHLREARAFSPHENVWVDDLSLDALEAAYGIESKLRLVAIRAASWFNARAYGQVARELERAADRNALITPAWRRLMSLWLYSVAHGDSWKRLEAHARHLLKIDPSLPAAKPALAYALGKQGRHKAAKLLVPHDYEEWIAQEPSTALSPTGEFGTVETSFPDVAALVDPKTLGATPREAFSFIAHACAYEHAGGHLAAVAELFLNAGRLRDCVRFFDRALEEDVPKSDRGRMLAVLGGALIAHDTARASKVFEEANTLLDEKKDPALVAALLCNWGALAMDLGQLKEAAARFNKSAKLANSAHNWIVTVNMQRALLDIEQNKPDAALLKARGAEQSFETSHQRGAAVALQGLTFLCTRQWKKATAELTRAQLFLKDSDLRQSARVTCELAIATKSPTDLDAAEAIFRRTGDRHGELLVATCRHILTNTPLPDLSQGPIEARLILRAHRK